MSWTETDEKKWKELTDRRDKNRHEVGKQYTINMLKEVIDALEGGRDIPKEIIVEPIFSDRHYAYDGAPPIIGKRVTLLYR